ncbi:MAG: transporter [Sphingomonas sp.]|nr:MAG: transporter [Sphingomonas sp.]
MNRLFAVAMTALVCASGAQANPPTSGNADAVLTLSRALELAGTQSPLLEAAEADSRAADAARTVAGLRPNPTLTTELENFAGSGAYRGTRSAEATASLGFPIELGGKRAARLALADVQITRASLGSVAAGADLKLNVTEAYAVAVATTQRLATARDEARIAADGARAARLRVEAGRASPIEAQRADLARINADAAVGQAERAASVARGALERLIGPVSGAQLDTGWFRHIPARTAAQAQGSLLLAAADADVAAADAGVRLAQSQRVPDLTLGAGARRLVESDSNAALVSLSVPMPLFQNGRAALAGARAERQAADARRRLTEIRLQQQIIAADAALADAVAAAATASGPALAAAEEAARIARIGYANGKFSQLDLLEAERSLSETRARATDALLATHLASAQLERLTARAPGQQDIMP